MVRLIDKSNAMLPDNICWIIKEKGLKRGAVAEKAGYSKQQLSDMINGRRLIKPCDIIALAKVLEVTVGDLFKERNKIK